MRWPRHLLTIDFETFWSDDYTLKKMSTEAYIRDPCFKAHGASIKYDNKPAGWITGAKLPAFFASAPWNDCAVLMHHGQFDGLILARHYGVRPALYLCTLAMARMALPRQRHSLDLLAQHFNLAAKGGALAQTKGVRVLEPWMEQQLGEYSSHDADLTREIFKLLLPSIPHTELPIIDATIRLFTEPRLSLDKPRARKLLASVIRSKRSAMRRLDVTRDQLASTDKFAALLEDRFGIEVEGKYGKMRKDGTFKLIPALAKTDPFMKSLLEYENPDVQALAATRLEVKSTLEETRLYRLLAMHERGPLCVYLNFAGAHTMRWSGGDKMNWQNFTRGSELRRCIVAPKGYVLVVCDLSQIEARMLNTLAEQWDVLADFEKGDPYSAMATDVYGRLITKTHDPLERQVGKVLELACGYGMGPPKLRNTLRVGALGGEPVIIDLETAASYVGKYRARHKRVVAYWGQAETAIQLLDARVQGYPWGPMMIDKGYIRLPNGTALDYTGIVREEGEWRMRNRAGQLMLNQFGAPIRLYGGLMTENVVQALSRICLADPIPTIRARFPIVMNNHDELVCMARADEADDCLKFMIETMTRRPSWLPKIPLAAEGGYDESYSK